MWMAGIVIVVIVVIIFMFRKKPLDKEAIRKRLTSLVDQIDNITKNLTVIKTEIANLEEKKVFNIVGELRELIVRLNEKIIGLENDIVRIRAEITEIKKTLGT